MKKYSIYQLQKFASEIPDLGKGGKTIKEYLTLAASQVRPDRSIIDIAPYLGSTTAYCALGANISEGIKTIYSFDLWEADKDYVLKAERHHQMNLDLNEDLRDRWLQNIKPFISDRCFIQGIKGDILQYTKFKGAPIGLYIDDICNEKAKHDQAIKTFLPFFVPGETVLFLMDYYFYERKSFKFLAYQKKFMEANKKSFLHIGRAGRTLTGIFLFLGDNEIIYPEGKQYYME